ncbi:DNRLRE domain-containing protein [Streptomyces sp. NPDC001811]
MSLGTGVGFATASGAARTVKASDVKSAATSADSVASALLTARTLNRKIEVLSERTEDSTTFALPSGELRTEAYAGPVRVKQDGTWKDIDTSLSDAGPDLAPVAAAADIAVSDGGDKQLASVAKGDETFGLRWENNLPSPTVKDNTASYDLGSGQTLSVTALAQGFSEDIKLTQRPGDDTVSYRIPLDLDGLKLSQAASGHLLLKNSDGHLVAEAPAPMMWDASKDPASGESAHQQQVKTEIETASDGAQTLVLTPDQDFLATATYPVTVDPTTTLAVTTDTWVQNPDYPDSQISSQELKSGTYDAGTDVARSYLKFDVSQFTGKHITGATMSLYNYYSATCSTAGAATVAKRITSGWSSSSITWGVQPSTTTTGMSSNTGHWGYDSSCPANWSHWNLQSIAQSWADGAPNWSADPRRRREGRHHLAALPLGELHHPRLRAEADGDLQLVPGCAEFAGDLALPGQRLQRNPVRHLAHADPVGEDDRPGRGHHQGTVRGDRGPGVRGHHLLLHRHLRLGGLRFHGAADHPVRLRPPGGQAPALPRAGL